MAMGSISSGPEGRSQWALLYRPEGKLKEMGLGW
jgi:hypothetical protein